MVTLDDFAGTSGERDIYSYSISKFEITQEIYEAVIGENPSKLVDAKKPVENVNWMDAAFFCNELTKKTMGAEHCYYKISGISRDYEGHFGQPLIYKFAQTSGFGKSSIVETTPWGI
ncbi:MAG: hypothetical protein MJ188_06765 [Treponema sp.]|nr:hypothetical protein [Treponema sp.]